MSFCRASQKRRDAMGRAMIDRKDTYIELNPALLRSYISFIVTVDGAHVVINDFARSIKLSEMRHTGTPKQIRYDDK